jgi:hypothetical protein
MKRFLFVGIALLLAQNAAAAPMTPRECNELVFTLNKDYPQVLDRITTIRNVICLEELGELTLVYRMQLDVKPGETTQATVDTLIPRMTNSWCTTPPQRELIEMVAIGYMYSDRTGKFIGTIHLNKKICVP